MSSRQRGSSLRGVNADAAIREILEDTAARTGGDFFAALVKSAAQVLDTHGAWVTEYSRDRGMFRALAFWLDDDFIPHYEYPAAGTPCEPVVNERKIVHVADRVVEIFPEDPDLPKMGGVS